MKKLLPIGSVVSLKGATKSVMIIGILQGDEEGNRFDYISCLYPEGYIDQETFFLFNHDDIEQVEFLGCINAEMQVYMERLKQQGALGSNEEE